MSSINRLLLQSQKNFLNLFRKDDNKGAVVVAAAQSLNPIRLFAMLSIIDWFTFFSAYFCVMIDFMEYSTVAVETVELAKYFKTSETAITTGLTLSMISGILGAILFGLLGDCGRKVPLIINCIYLGLTQILITQCTSIKYFLIVKAMTGFAMGGLFGNALQSVMDRIPTQAKGLMAGLLWSAGDFAIFLTSGIKFALSKTTKRNDWTTIFWISAGLCFLAALIRTFVPESPQFVQDKKEKEQQGDKCSLIEKVKKRKKETKAEMKIFMTNVRQLFKTHWMIFIYLTLFVWLLSSVLNIYEAIYPIFLEEGKSFDKQSVPKIILFVSTGGFFGSCSGAGFSQGTGRRICVIIAVFAALCLLPAYILPTHPISLSIGGFFFIMASNMANSVISIHISELSSPAFRSVMSGLTYQLGNTIASPTGVLINAIAAHFQTQKINSKGEIQMIKAYGPVIGILTAILYVLLLILTAIGPEKHSANFDDFIPANKQVLETPDIQLCNGTETTNSLTLA